MTKRIRKSKPVSTDNGLRVVHLVSGPNGYAVLNAKKEVIAENLKQGEALNLVREDKPEVKFTPIHRIPSLELDGSVVDRRADYRRRREWLGHRQGQ